VTVDRGGGELLATRGFDGRCIGLYGNRHGASTSRKAYLLLLPARVSASAFLRHDRGLSTPVYADFRVAARPD
jgi:hypothetical protein